MALLPSLSSSSETARTHVRRRRPVVHKLYPGLSYSPTRSFYLVFNILL